MFSYLCKSVDKKPNSCYIHPAYQWFVPVYITQYIQAIIDNRSLCYILLWLDWCDDLSSEYYNSSLYIYRKDTIYCLNKNMIYTIFASLCFSLFFPKTNSMESTFDFPICMDICSYVFSYLISRIFSMNLSYDTSRSWTERSIVFPKFMLQISL